jgi:hypothetical protein
MKRVRMLFDLLAKGTSQNSENPTARPAWDKRKALVCTSEPYREVSCAQTDGGGCQVLWRKTRARQLKRCGRTRWTWFTRAAV